jgi:hypothetical protein
LKYSSLKELKLKMEALVCRLLAPLIRY